MEEADELCNRLAIIDHGRLLALGTPAELKRSTGADTVVTVTADGDLDALAKVLEADVAGRARRRRASTPRSCVEVQATQRRAARVVFGAAERHGFERHRPLRRPSRRSRPSSSTSPGRTCANDRHLRHRHAVRARDRPASRSPPPACAFRALILRDLVVLRKTLKEFIPRTILQPFLLVFVFTYVFPKIGQGVGGAGAGERASRPCSSPASSASRSCSRASSRSSLPMVQEFGYTREIEDRVLAPMPVWLVAIQKAIVGRARAGSFSALLVFPIAAVVPATPVHLDVNWLVLLTLTPLACYMCGALGLTFGTRFDPRTVPLLFGIIVIPLTFLGCVYYSWSSLEPIRWLQIARAREPARLHLRGLPRRAHHVVDT